MAHIFYLKLKNLISSFLFNLIRVDHQWCRSLQLTWIPECWTNWWPINGLLHQWLKLLALLTGSIIEEVLPALQVWDCASQAHSICNTVENMDILRQDRLPSNTHELKKFQTSRYKWSTFRQHHMSNFIFKKL